jgi:hypothetical protein
MAIVSNIAKNVGVLTKIILFYLLFLPRKPPVIFLSFEKPAFNHLATGITDGLADLQTITDPVSSLMTASLDIVGMRSYHILYNYMYITASRYLSWKNLFSIQNNI